MFISWNDKCEEEKPQAVTSRYSTDESKEEEAAGRKSKLGKLASGRSSYDLKEKETEDSRRGGRSGGHQAGRHRGLIDLRPDDRRWVRIWKRKGRKKDSEQLSRSRWTA